MLDRLFRPRACPLPAPGARRACLRPHHFAPLAAFLLPTAIIGYGVVLPHSCAAGVNALSISFATTLIGMAASYVVGIRLALSR